ncbi:hypothetical protein [Solibacillus sp. FSL K6-1523]|uniref:hypothetical protein n=1 Tax=Solibacillus sp. FSL K6-1523 TaxID=2921471 RepID=UPI0030F99931
MKKWQWIIASVLFFTILGFNTFGDITVKRTIKRVVYSSEDLIFMRAVLSDIAFPENKQVTVNATPDESIEQLLAYAMIERYNDGFLLSYEEPLLLKALYDGLIVFTGHTKYNGKTISIIYEDGTTVTMGYVDQLSVLPYMPVSKGEVIAVKEKGKLYIQIEKDGEVYNIEQTTKWLKEQHT